MMFNTIISSIENLINRSYALNWTNTVNHRDLVIVSNEDLFIVEI